MRSRLRLGTFAEAVKFPTQRGFKVVKVDYERVVGEENHHHFFQPVAGWSDLVDLEDSKDTYRKVTIRVVVLTGSL